MGSSLGQRRKDDKAHRRQLARAVETYAAGLAGWAAADMAEAAISPEQQAIEDYKRAQAGESPRSFTPPRKSWGTPEQPAPLTNLDGEAPPELRQHRHGESITDGDCEIVFAFDGADRERAWRRDSGKGSGPPPDPECQRPAASNSGPGDTLAGQTSVLGGRPQKYDRFFAVARCAANAAACPLAGGRR